MTTAREVDEAISGDKITFQFGKVHTANEAQVIRVSLGLNGEAWVARRWRRGPAPVAVPIGHDRLVARSARGECADVTVDHLKKHAGAHRSYTGVMVGEAVLRVVIPRDA